MNIELHLLNEIVKYTLLELKEYNVCSRGGSTPQVTVGNKPHHRNFIAIKKKI